MIYKGKYLAVVQSEQVEEFLAQVEQLEAEGYQPINAPHSFKFGPAPFGCIMGNPEKDPAHQAPAEGKAQADPDDEDFGLPAPPAEPAKSSPAPGSAYASIEADRAYA